MVASAKLAEANRRIADLERNAAEAVRARAAEAARADEAERALRANIERARTAGPPPPPRPPAPPMRRLFAGVAAALREGAPLIVPSRASRLGSTRSRARWRASTCARRR